MKRLTTPALTLSLALMGCVRFTHVHERCGYRCPQGQELCTALVQDLCNNYYDHGYFELTVIPRGPGRYLKEKERKIVLEFAEGVLSNLKKPGETRTTDKVGYISLTVDLGKDDSRVFYGFAVAAKDMGVKYVKTHPRPFIIEKSELTNYQNMVNKTEKIIPPNYTDIFELVQSEDYGDFGTSVYGTPTNSSIKYLPLSEDGVFSLPTNIDLESTQIVVPCGVVFGDNEKTEGKIRVLADQLATYVSQGGQLVLTDHHAPLFNMVYLIGMRKAWIVPAREEKAPLSIGTIGDANYSPEFVFGTQRAVLKSVLQHRVIDEGDLIIDNDVTIWDQSRLIRSLNTPYPSTNYIGSVDLREAGKQSRIWKQPAIVEAKIERGWMIFSTLHLSDLTAHQLIELRRVLEGPVAGKAMHNQLGHYAPSLLRLRGEKDGNRQQSSSI